MFSWIVLIRETEPLDAKVGELRQLDHYPILSLMQTCSHPLSLIPSRPSPEQAQYS